MLSLPHGPQSEPSGLMGFSCALSILLSNVCVVHMCAMAMVYNRKIEDSKLLKLTNPSEEGTRPSKGLQGIRVKAKHRSAGSTEEFD